MKEVKVRGDMEQIQNLGCGEGRREKGRKKGRRKEQETLMYTAIGSGNNEEMRDRKSNGGRG